MLVEHTAHVALDVLDLDLDDGGADDDRASAAVHLIHLSVGEEAVEVGVCAQLADKDDITNTLPGHGIAKGVDIAGMVAEPMGKATGSCKGKGGSMHIADVDKGMLGANMANAMLMAIGLVYLILVILVRLLLVPVVILFALLLASIVVTNAIVQHKIEAGDDVRTALIQGVRTHVRPILMTAAATILALIPLAFSSSGGLIAAKLGHGGDRRPAQQRAAHPGGDPGDLQPLS